MGKLMRCLKILLSYRFYQSHQEMTQYHLLTSVFGDTLYFDIPILGLGETKRRPILSVEIERESGRAEKCLGGGERYERACEGGLETESQQCLRSLV